MPITVLSFYDRISLFQTLKPLLFYKDKKVFEFTNSVDYCLKQDKNKILFIFRWFLKPDYVDLDQMKKLREKYDKIFFFNGNAGAGIPRLKLLEYVDLFFNKAIFRDINRYQKDYHGDELYNQYYHDKYKINYQNNKERAVLKNQELADKIKVYWNIGIGDFPKRTLIQRGGVWFARRSGNAESAKPFHHWKNRVAKTHNSEKYNISAQLGLYNDPFLNFHRERYLPKIKPDDRFLTDSVPQWLYNKQISNSKIVFSPFGWGELCFRDFEAVISGSLLMKPDVSHLDTWPNVFKPDETYVSVDWDGDDILEKAEYWLSHDKERREVIKNASASYIDQVDRVEERLDDILAML